MASMWTMLRMPAIVLPLATCQAIATPTSGTDAVDALRRDICTRAWKGVTTSRHDVLTEQTKLEIAQDTAARGAYCKGVLP